MVYSSVDRIKQKNGAAESLEAMADKEGRNVLPKPGPSKIETDPVSPFSSQLSLKIPGIKLVSI